MVSAKINPCELRSRHLFWPATSKRSVNHHSASSLSHLFHSDEVRSLVNEFRVDSTQSTKYIVMIMTTMKEKGVNQRKRSIATKTKTIVLLVDMRTTVTFRSG
jgi:hypothetical protein